MAVLPTISQSSLTCIASNTRSLHLETDLVHLIPGRGRAGSVVACRVITVGAYKEMEDRTGRLVRLNPGDLVIGVLGDRHSTTSMFGGLPKTGIELPTAEAIDLLSVGGVIGYCESWPSYLGSPTKLEVLGLVLSGEEPLNTEAQLCMSERLEVSCPIVLVAGTAAEVGKTTFATNVVHFLSRRLGRHVAATKLAGTGRFRDLLNMRDAGARPALDFVDGGLATTYGPSGDFAVPVAKGILNRLGADRPEVIIAELGGDILGARVPDILGDTEIRKAACALVLVPSDMLAAHGALSILTQTQFSNPVYLGVPIRNIAASKWRAETFLVRPIVNAMDEESLAPFITKILG